MSDVSLTPRKVQNTNDSPNTSTKLNVNKHSPESDKNKSRTTIIPLEGFLDEESKTEKDISVDKNSTPISSRKTSQEIRNNAKETENSASKKVEEPVKTSLVPLSSENASPLDTSKITTVSGQSQKSKHSQNDSENTVSPEQSRTLQSIYEMPYPESVILPKRYVLLFMIFLGFAVIYSLRVNINVAIVAMVNNKTVMGKNGKVEVFLAEFNWDPHIQAFVVGSFYYGYWVLQVPGAWIAMKLGGTRIFGYGVLLSSLLSIVTPVATRYHVMALVGIRIVQGLFLGVTYPCNIAIWAKWAPPLERSTMVTMAIAGSPVGNIIAIPLTGLLAKYGFDGGWPSVFYFFGSVGVLWYIVWECIIYDSPNSHPKISYKEKKYIEKSIGEKPFDPMVESPPWRAIFTSIPMWAIIFGHFGACWGYYTLFTQMPTYLKDIQHLDIKTMGLVAATPYILKAFLGPLGGISADMLVKYKYLSIRSVRVLFYGIGCIFAGFFILMCGYYSKTGQAIAFLVLGIGFSGLNQIGYAVNHLDIAPRYAGILMGVTNTFATVPGFLSPLVTGYIARNKVAEEWRIVFWITFIIYVVATFLYSLMCSGERQWWAEGYPEETVSEENALDETTDDSIVDDEENNKESNKSSFDKNKENTQINEDKQKKTK